MDIRFTSTLTSEDEGRVAGALLAALVALLEDLPITYAIRIETTGQKVFQRTKMPNDVAAGEPASDPALEPLLGAEQQSNRTPPVTIVS